MSGRRTYRGYIEAEVPALIDADYTVESDATFDYNCIGWAAGFDNEWWWPVGGREWPLGVPRVLTMEAFVLAFGTVGYVACEHHEPEPGFEKIAIFALADGTPTHAARELPNGRWTSKLGRLSDVEHILEHLIGEPYGKIAVVMRREKQ